MSEEKITGLKNEVVGKVKEMEGKLTGDELRKKEGQTQGLFGKAQTKAEDLKEDLKSKVDKLKDKFENNTGK